MSDIFAVVTGGGTAGHVLPALAVAEALVAGGRDADSIHYIGCERGVETRLLPATPFSATFFDVVGFQRSLSRRNLGFVPKMIRSTRAAIKLFDERRPEVVVSVGGYASMPAVFAARRLKIPVVVVSYDRRPGRASTVAAKRAVACAVAFENSPLQRATVTGAPVRQAVLDVDRVAGRADARRLLGIPEDRFLIAVMGGSLGSGVLNQALASYIERHRDDASLAVRQVAGDRFVDDIVTIEPSEGQAGVLHQVIGYEDDMPAVYAAADLMIGRGGASTVHEVAVTGTPAVLVPWAGAADDHQSGNVAWLADDGAAVLVTESELEGLGQHLDALRQDDEARTALGRAAAVKGRVHRSGALAELIERVVVTSPPS